MVRAQLKDRRTKLTLSQANAPIIRAPRPYQIPQGNRPNLGSRRPRLAPRQPFLASAFELCCSRLGKVKRASCIAHAQHTNDGANRDMKTYSAAELADWPLRHVGMPCVGRQMKLWAAAKHKTSRLRRLLHGAKTHLQSMSSRSTRRSPGEDGRLRALQVRYNSPVARPGTYSKWNTTHGVTPDLVSRSASPPKKTA